MLKIMRPIDLFEIPRPQEQFKYSLQEQFFVQFNRIIEQKLQEILKDTFGLFFQLFSPSISEDTVFSSLKIVSEKLIDCKKLIANYLIITKTVDHTHDTAAVEFLSKVIPTVVELINKVTIHNSTEKEQIDALSKTCQELSNIISEQNIKLKISQENISELLEIIDQVGREYDSNPIALGMIKTSIKHVFYHDNPIGFINSLMGSTLDSMTELQSVIGEDSYTDEKKIEFIKLFIAKFPDLSFSAKEYILQLGCELLKLGDPQSALEIFSSSAAEEITSSPKFLFDQALALVELGGKDNYLNAKYQLEKLIKIVQTEVQSEIIDLNKVKVLLVTTLDKLGQYEEAIECYKQLSQAYQPEIVFETFMLLKYSAFLASIEPRSMLKKEITDKVCTLIKDEQIVRTLEEAQDADFCYLIGMGYASQNNLLKANEYFKQAIDIFQGQSVLITAKSYVTYHMLCVGVMTHDPELVSKLLTTIDIDVDWLPPGYDCTPLYLAAEDLKTNIPEMLLDKGANPFSINSLTELTPVHRAITSLNHRMLEKVCALKQYLPNHEAEQSMDYQLGMVDVLPYSEKIRLAEYLDKLGYNTEFQAELLAETANHFDHL